MSNPGKYFRTALTFSSCLFSVCMVLNQTAMSQDLYGEWRGGGFARPGIFGAKEKIFCKVSGKSTGTGHSKLSGRCAVASKSGTFSLQISETSGRKITAIANFAGYAEPLTFSGRKQSSGYVMRSNKPITQEKITFNSQFSISFSGTSKMTFRETAVDVSNGQKMTVLSISFIRQ